jgi:hypothetical protein
VRPLASGCGRREGRRGETWGSPPREGRAFEMDADHAVGVVFREAGGQCGRHRRPRAGAVRSGGLVLWQWHGICAGKSSLSGQRLIPGARGIRGCPFQFAPAASGSPGLCCLLVSSTPIIVVARARTAGPTTSVKVGTVTW